MANPKHKTTEDIDLKSLITFVAGRLSNVEPNTSANFQAIQKALEKMYTQKADRSLLSSLLKSIDDNFAQKNYVYGGFNALQKSTALSHIQHADLEIATAAVKALNATPQAILSLPGAGKYLDPLALELFLDYESAAYVVGATYDLSLEYETSGQILQVETTGFMDQTSDQRRFAHRSSNIIGVNEAVVIKILNGELTTGDSPLKCRVFYRVREALA